MNTINLIFILTIWWCAHLESISLVFLEEGVCYDQCVLLAKLYKTLLFFILRSKAKPACYSRYLFSSYFCIPVPYDERTFLLLVLGHLVDLYKTIQLSFFGISGWGIDLDYLILNGLPWKQTEIILSFFRLHPSTAFWTLLLTIRATPFLISISCPQ